MAPAAPPSAPPPAPPPDRLPGAIRGIFYMLGMTFLSAAMNTAARHISDGIHPFEVVFFRNTFGLLFVLPMLARHGFIMLRTQRFGTHLSRATLNVINMMFFFSAVAITPLAELVALGFSAPIMATLMAVLIFREIVGTRRWSAMFVGFLGALVILQPGLQTLYAGHALTLLAAATWAGVLLFIKALSRTESSLTIVAYATLLMSPLSLIPAVFVWTWPDANQWFWLAAIGLGGTLSQFCLAQALHETDLSVIMPFDFSKLVWIALFAYVAFGEVPALTTWLGGALIFAAGIYIAHREASAARGG